MAETVRRPFGTSIAGRLALVLIAVYTLITVTLTALIVYSEFHSAKKSVLAELGTMATAVSHGLAAAIFNVDDEQVNAILSGLAASASIRSLRVERQYQGEIAMQGRSATGEDLDGEAPEDPEFAVTMELPYTQLDGSTVTVGFLTFQSSAHIVFGRVRTGLFSILAVSAIQLFCMCLVIIPLSVRMVSRPLGELTKAVSGVSLDTLDSGLVDLPARGISELRTLQNAFNTMLGRLSEHREAREQAEDKYRSIYQNAVEGVFQSTPQGRFVTANPAMAALLGYDDSKDLLASIRDMFHDLYLDRDIRSRFLEPLRRGENVTGLEARVRRKDGGLIWMTCNARPVFDRHGKLKLIEGMAVDTTKRRQAEAAMRQAMEAAENASRMKSDFISMVSHELRTPLTAVLGFAKVIRKKLGAEIQPRLSRSDAEARREMERVMENLAVINQEGERLSGLISEVLDLSRLESGAVGLRKTRMSVSRALDRAQASVAVLLEEKGLYFRKEEAPGLPLVEADEDRIVQVCINLLANAVKFTESGGITCRLDLIDNHVRVRVEDTGPGVASRDRDDIFNKFKQLGDTLTDRPQGVGLGLAICKEIVVQHGGRIGVESSPGSGSVFTFTIPV